jgi:hypothetical protein
VCLRVAGNGGNSMKLSMRPVLCCLAFIVMLPCASLTAYGIYSDRQAAAAAAREGFAEILHRTAVRCGRQAEHARSLLLSLADNEKVRGGYRAELMDIFTDIVLSGPGYANMHLVDLDGTIRVSALPSLRESASLREFCAAAAQNANFSMIAVPGDARTGRAAFRYAVPLREGVIGATTACLTAEVYFDGEERELPSRMDGASLVLRDASGRVTALYAPDRGMSGNAGMPAGGDAAGDRVVFEHEIPGGTAQDAFPVLVLSVPADAVYGEGDDIVRRRVPVTVAAVVVGLLAACVLAGARAAAPLSEAAAAARAPAGGLALSADGRSGFLPERAGKDGGDDGEENGSAPAFDEAAALRAALDKTAARLLVLRTTAAEAAAAGEEADKTWNDVLFSLGRDMREPVNTIQDMAHVAGKAARSPRLRGFLDDIVSAGRELGTLSDELAALHETELDTRAPRT